MVRIALSGQVNSSFKLFSKYLDLAAGIHFSCATLAPRGSLLITWSMVDTGNWDNRQILVYWVMNVLETSHNGLNSTDLCSALLFCRRFSSTSVFLRSWRCFLAGGAWRDAQHSGEFLIPCLLWKSAKRRLPGTPCCCCSLDFTDLCWIVYINCAYNR